jgi:hypothetical protein
VSRFPGSFGSHFLLCFEIDGKSIPFPACLRSELRNTLMGSNSSHPVGPVLPDITGMRNDAVCDICDGVVER